MINIIKEAARIHEVDSNKEVKLNIHLIDKNTYRIESKESIILLSEELQYNYKIVIIDKTKTEETKEYSFIGEDMLKEAFENIIYIQY